MSHLPNESWSHLCQTLVLSKIHLTLVWLQVLNLKHFPVQILLYFQAVESRWKTFFHYPLCTSTAYTWLKWSRLYLSVLFWSKWQRRCNLDGESVKFCGKPRTFMYVKQKLTIWWNGHWSSLTSFVSCHQGNSAQGHYCTLYQWKLSPLWWYLL